MAAVESIPCPRCGAGPGQTCMTPDGTGLPTGHATRWATLFTPNLGYAGGDTEGNPQP